MDLSPPRWDRRCCLPGVTRGLWLSADPSLTRGLQSPLSSPPRASHLCHGSPKLGWPGRDGGPRKAAHTAGDSEPFALNTYLGPSSVLPLLQSRSPTGLLRPCSWEGGGPGRAAGRWDWHSSATTLPPRPRQRIRAAPGSTRPAARPPCEKARDCFWGFSGGSPPARRTPPARDLRALPVLRRPGSPAQPRQQGLGAPWVHGSGDTFTRVCGGFLVR